MTGEKVQNNNKIYEKKHANALMLVMWNCLLLAIYKLPFKLRLITMCKAAYYAQMYLTNIFVFPLSKLIFLYKLV